MGSLARELKKIDLVKSDNLLSVDGWIDFFSIQTNYVCVYPIQTHKVLLPYDNKSSKHV